MKAAVSEMVSIIQEAKHSYYGIRSGRAQQIGDIIPPSHDWDFENDCESEDLLPGACTTGVNTMFSDNEWLIDKLTAAVNANSIYDGDQQYLVGGNSAVYGDDESELIIEDAQVLYIIK